MSLSAEQIGEFRAFAEQLADAAAVAIKPYSVSYTHLTLPTNREV